MLRYARIAGAAALLGATLIAVAPLEAQVAYQPYRPAAPTPYGYPVPYGYLQPDEALGTSPSFEINTGLYGRRPVVRVLRQCQYPDGWNTTDFTRDVNGTPGGLEHACPIGGPGSRRVAY